MSYHPDTSRPVIVPRGQTVARLLSVHNGLTSATVTGSYVLYNRSGTSVASGSVVAGSVSVAVPSDLDLGAGAWEEWTLSAPLTATIRQAVYVSRSLDSRFNLCSSLILQATRSWLALGYPAGQSDWETACEIATIEVLRLLVSVTEWSSPTALDLWDSSVLVVPAVKRALAIIYRDAHAMTGAAHLLEESRTLDTEFDAWWQRSPLAWGDSTGAGPDTLPGMMGRSTAPAPGPAAGR